MDHGVTHLSISQGQGVVEAAPRGHVGVGRRQQHQSGRYHFFDDGFHASGDGAGHLEEAEYNTHFILRAMMEPSTTVGSITPDDGLDASKDSAGCLEVVEHTERLTVKSPWGDGSWAPGQGRAQHTLRTDVRFGRRASAPESKAPSLSP